MIILKRPKSKISNKTDHTENLEEIKQKSEYEYIEEDIKEIDDTLEEENIIEEKNYQALDSSKQDSKGLYSFADSKDVISEDEFIISSLNADRKQQNEHDSVLPNEFVLPNATVIEKEPFISPILDLATSRPAEVIKDMDVNIDQDEFIEADKIMSQKEFELMLKEGEYKYLDLSHMRNVVDFTFLKDQKSLVQLSLFGNTQLHDISFLKELKNLEVLNVGATGIKDISVVKHLTNLNILNIAYTDISDISSISYLKNLHDLIMRGLNKVTNINSLKGNSELVLLDAGDTVRVDDISPVSYLKNLENLYVDHCPLKSVEAIRELYNLKVFSLESKNLAIKDIAEPFKDLTELRFLNLRRSRLSNIKPLKKLTNMLMLDIGYGSFVDLESISDMTQMRRLTVDENAGIADISPLEKMKNLLVLDVSGDRITDVSVLYNFDNLVELDMNNNILIQDITAVENCSKLEEIYLSGCLMLGDIYPLRKLTKLLFVILNKMPRLIDISPLKNSKGMFILDIDSTNVPYSQIIEFKRHCSLASLSTIGSDEHYRRAKIAFGKRRKLNNLRKSLKF